MFGIGIGIIIAIIFTLPVKLGYGMSDGNIEIKARNLGMCYPDEIKIQMNEENRND